MAELSPDNQKLAAQIAAVPMTMRGYGHVKLANLALARGREAELLHRFAPERYPRPAGEAKAGQIRGIAVVARRPGATKTNKQTRNASFQRAVEGRETRRLSPTRSPDVRHFFAAPPASFRHLPFLDRLSPGGLAPAGRRSGGLARSGLHRLDRTQGRSSEVRFLLSRRCAGDERRTAVRLSLADDPPRAVHDHRLRGRAHPADRAHRDRQHDLCGSLSTSPGRLHRWTT